MSVRTLERLRQRACEAGIEAALHGQPRQQWPVSTYTGEVEAHLVAAACSAPPDGHPHWTLQLESIKKCRAVGFNHSLA